MCLVSLSYYFSVQNNLKRWKWKNSILLRVMMHTISVYCLGAEHAQSALEGALTVIALQRGSSAPVWLSSRRLPSVGVANGAGGGVWDGYVPFSERLAYGSEELDVTGVEADIIYKPASISSTYAELVEIMTRATARLSRSKEFARSRLSPCEHSISLQSPCWGVKIMGVTLFAAHGDLHHLELFKCGGTTWW